MSRLAPLGGLMGAILLALPGMGQSSASPDEEILTAAGLPTDSPSLLELLRRSGGDHTDAIRRWIDQLGTGSFKDREAASRQLLLHGPAALPELRRVVNSSSVETARRAETLITAIEAMGPEVLVAAARLLAGRRDAQATEVLLRGLSTTTDGWLAEEWLACLGTLTISDGKPTTRLIEAARAANSHERALAGHILATRGGAEARVLVQTLLTDPDAYVRDQTALGVTGKRGPQMAADTAAHDDLILKQHFGLVDAPTLLAFLRRRTLSTADQARLRRWVADLGHPKYGVRQEASRRLIEEGAPALPYLAPATMASDTEVARRARLCELEIRKGPGPALPTAVLHWLVRSRAKDHAPAEAARVVLDYLPFADDDAVAETAVNALLILAARDIGVEPHLAAALADPQPARRGAAALVLGRLGTKTALAAVRKLLDDPDPSVRFQAGLGLLAAHDATAIPTLIDLLAHVPFSSALVIEDALQRLAGEHAPNVPRAGISPATRGQAAAAWQSWWKAHAPKVDWGRLCETHAYLGLITICEYDNGNGMPAGRVWETNRGSEPRWSLSGLFGAMDAHVLPNGNILVAENSANRVTERRKDGSIHWEIRVPGNPVACQRLPNGNTFIASYNNVMEVDPQGKTIYNHQRGPAFYIFSAQKTRSGKIVCMTAQGAVLEIDAATGKELRTINLGPNGGWCSAEALPTGRYLVATMNNGLVREVDVHGKVHWQASFPGVFRATRLPNGHTLVASMTTKRVAELDRSGQVRWEKTCEGRPWGIHWR
ncbi:MAG: HEAT repeat domain-containing protein [Gemmataceae bacterium]|nr:HEAT repeat domain-containing protein [Gemmataceae bacterium]